MHESSLRKMQVFKNIYLPPSDSVRRVLDVGSMAYEEHDSYRPCFGQGFEYVGLDLDEGPNVDVVPAEPYSWKELETASFDAVISGQVFEHNPYPWVTMAEIARVLRPGGILCLIAPSRGPVHRYPLDCWRYYPDAASALCAYVGIELLESYVEPSGGRIIDGEWGDFFLVARRDEVDTDHLARIVATRRPIPQPAEAQGPAIQAYETSVFATPTAVRRHRFQATALAGLRKLRPVLTSALPGR